MQESAEVQGKEKMTPTEFAAQSLNVLVLLQDTWPSVETRPIVGFLPPRAARAARLFPDLAMCRECENEYRLPHLVDGDGGQMSRASKPKLFHPNH
eukprot:3384485-Amphidinium_carterae.1